MSVRFALEKETSPRTGALVDAVVKYSHPNPTLGQEPEEREVWCSVEELDRLFEAASKRWGRNWDLEKVLIAVREADFD